MYSLKIKIKKMFIIISLKIFKILSLCTLENLFYGMRYDLQCARRHAERSSCDRIRMHVNRMHEFFFFEDVFWSVETMRDNGWNSFKSIWNRSFPQLILYNYHGWDSVYAVFDCSVEIIRYAKYNNKEAARVCN